MSLGAVSCVTFLIHRRRLGRPHGRLTDLPTKHSPDRPDRRDAVRPRFQERQEAEHTSAPTAAASVRPTCITLCRFFVYRHLLTRRMPIWSQIKGGSRARCRTRLLVRSWPFPKIGRPRDGIAYRLRSNPNPFRGARDQCFQRSLHCVTLNWISNCHSAQGAMSPSPIGLLPYFKRSNSAARVPCVRLGRPDWQDCIDRSKDTHIQCIL
jgi:hypothetical protein